jgi:Leucine-rich repeat (LRR) protein
VPGLTEILLDKNQISLIPPQPFRMSRNDSRDEVIEIFDIVSGQTFQAVPDMMDMTSLTKISATYNKLVTLPDTIYKLTNLSELYLDNNQLTSLPEELGEVQTLTLLTLLNNELTVLPVTIGQLNELEVFEADFDTKIIAPPQEITKVRKAKGLSHVLEYMLAFTDARRAPEIELIELELMTVPRELMEDEVGKITSTIKSVSLASNKLSKLPSDMYSLASIAALDLSENHIQELPEGFVDMKTLEALVSFTPCPGLQFVVYVDPAGQGRGRVWDLLIS